MFDDFYRKTKKHCAFVTTCIIVLLKVVKGAKQGAKGLRIPNIA